MYFRRKTGKTNKVGMEMSTVVTKFSLTSENISKDVVYNKCFLNQVLRDSSTEISFWRRKCTNKSSVPENSFKIRFTYTCCDKKKHAKCVKNWLCGREEIIG